MEVHFSDAVAQWLVAQHAVPASALVKKNAELFPGVTPPTFLTHEAALELHNGLVFARLLQTLFAANGAVCSASPADLGPGNDAKVVLRNYKEVLCPVLQTTFAITLDGDKLALLVGGDSEVLRTTVEVLHSRALGLADVKTDQAAGAAGGVVVVNELSSWFAKTFDADVQDNIMLALSLFVGVYSAVLGSLLGIFVPQACPPSSQNPQVHVCTSKENFIPQSQLNAAVLVFNFLTMFTVLGAQFYYAYREWWCIESFDYSTTMAVENLVEEIALYPTFEAKLRRMNRDSLAVAVGVIALVALNLALSATHVLRDYSTGKSSATGLLSNTLLLLPRVAGWVLNAYAAYSSGRPVSMFKKVAAVPSTIDEDWRFDPKFYKPRYGSAAVDDMRPQEGETIGLLAPQAAGNQHGLAAV